MSNSTPVLMIIFVFAFVPLVLAEVARKKAVPTIENFFVQDRKMPLLMVFFTVYSTWVSSFAFLGGSSYFYAKGPVYLTAFAWNALFGIMFMVIGKRIWYYGKAQGYITPTDFFNDIYASPILNFFITSIMLVFTLPYLQIQLLGGAYIIEIASNGMIPYKISGLLFYLIIIIYLWAGGLRAVALADIFYGILIFISMLTMGFFLISKTGGIDYVFKTIHEIGKVNLTITSDFDNSGILLWLSMFAVIPLGAIMGPQLWIRAYAVERKKTFHIMPFLITSATIMYLGSILSGSAGILLLPGVEETDTIIPKMLLLYGSEILAAVCFCGIAAASLSTANSQIHAVAAIYTIDIHKRYLQKNASENRLVAVGKWVVLFISAMAYLLMLQRPGLIIETGVVALGGTAQVIVPTLGALFWNKSNYRAAIIGLSIGILCLTILKTVFDLNASLCGLIALIINGLLFIVVSFWLKPNAETRFKITQYKRDYDQNN